MGSTILANMGCTMNNKAALRKMVRVYRMSKGHLYFFNRRESRERRDKLYLLPFQRLELYGKIESFKSWIRGLSQPMGRLNISISANQTLTDRLIAKRYPLTK